MLLIDGHSGVSNFAYSNTMGGISSNNNDLNKPLSNTFLLRVSGINIYTFEQNDLQIFENMVHDVWVNYSVTDIDGNVYPIVRIGNQWWMAENLKVTHYSNGDAIPNVTGNSEWGNLTTGAYCYYDNNSNKAADYGALYNWYAVNDSRNIAPAGWHVPTDEEWKQMEMYLGMSQSDADKWGMDRGTLEGGKLKETGTSHWNSPNVCATNESGFTARPGGKRHYSGGLFFDMGLSAYFWSSTKYDNNQWSALNRWLDYLEEFVMRETEFKQWGFSVRCVRFELAENQPPIASFTVTPLFGTIETDFIFDASACTDNEDATSALQVRWDWENDGVWDTGYTTSKIAKYQYNTDGIKTIKLQVKDTCDLTAETTRQVTVNVENTAPKASFTVTPESGTTNTNFSFDASGSTDNEDDISVLQVRWDFYNDGSWNTGFSTTKTTTKKYSTGGTKTIKLEVMDTGGFTDTTTREITVKSKKETGTMTDIDGNVYQTVKIGDQWWMAENLKVTHYRNGDAIHHEIDNRIWDYLTTGSYCYYNNNSSNAADYGALYNWYAVNDNRNIAPAGWHVPSDAEWKQLEMFLGMSQSDADDDHDRGTNEGGKLKEAGTSHWNSPNTGATNESGFSARAGGHLLLHNPYFDYMGYNAIFWSSTLYDNLRIWCRYLICNDARVGRYSYLKKLGLSVRCVKN